MFAETADMARGRGFRACEETLEDGVVPLEYGDAAWLEAVEDFRLGVGDRLDGGEILDVDGRRPW